MAKLNKIEKVVAIEGRKKNINKANFVKEIKKIENITFLCENLEKIDLQTLGRFDAVFCSGLLYHLPKPWKLIENINRVSNNLFIWTHYADAMKAKVTRNGYKGLIFREWLFLYEALSGLSPTSFWPTKDELLRMLANYGFTNIVFMDDHPNHEQGPAITIAVNNPNN